MPQDGDSCYEESFNSFLAGVLLTKRKINNFEFFNLMNTFQNVYNVDIVSVGSEICVPIYFDDNEINLLKELDTEILVNGNNITIRDYLYSFTTSRVRDFFRIPDVIVKKEKKPSVFVRILLKKKIAI